jgi:hypothetical protein
MPADPDNGCGCTTRSGGLTHRFTVTELIHTNSVTRHRPPDDADAATGVEFPDLDPGLTVLEFDERLVHGLQALVVDHLLDTDGRAWWVDVDGYVRTTALREIAPSRRLLDRVHVARAFTVFQHATLLGTLDDRIDAVDEPPAAVVCPAVDRLARASDLDSHEAERYQLANVATLAGLARGRDCPVVVTRTDETPGDVDDALRRAADRVLTCERTRFGPRFVGADTETLVYAAGPLGWRQTTLTYWARILEARATGEQPTAIEPAGASPSGAN